MAIKYQTSNFVVRNGKDDWHHLLGVFTYQLFRLITLNIYKVNISKDNLYLILILFLFLYMATWCLIP